jgi:hypothetical protein
MRRGVTQAGLEDRTVAAAPWGAESVYHPWPKEVPQPRRGGIFPEDHAPTELKITTRCLVL